MVKERMNPREIVAYNPNHKYVKVFNCWGGNFIARVTPNNFSAIQHFLSLEQTGSTPSIENGSGAYTPFGVNFIRVSLALLVIIPICFL